MCRKTRALFLLLIIFILVGLFSALMPVSDFDQDGAADSLITESVLLLPMLPFVTCLVLLLVKRGTVSPLIPTSFSTPIFPPPIYN
jgi:hypothetical protein